MAGGIPAASWPPHNTLNDDAHIEYGTAEVWVVQKGLKLALRRMNCPFITAEG
jgi:hypothetical protein